MSILNLVFFFIDQSLIDDLVPFVVFRKARQDEVEMIMHNTFTLSTSAPNIHVTPHSSHTPDYKDYDDYDADVGRSDKPLPNSDADTVSLPEESTITVKTDTPISTPVVQSSHTTLFAISTTMLHTTQQNMSYVTLADSGKDEQSGTNMTASILGKAQPSSVVHTSLYDLPSPMSATSIATTLPASPQAIYINKNLYIICNIGHAFI